MYIAIAANTTNPKLSKMKITITPKGAVVRTDAYAGRKAYIIGVKIN